MQNTAEPASLARRLRRLEFLFLLAAGVAVLAVAFGGASPAPQETIRSRRFELVDAQGRVRAVLGTDAAGAAGLFIHDEAGGLRLSLVHDPEQSALFIRDGEGTVRLGAAQFAHGGGGFALHGPEANGAAVLYFKDTGSLSFYGGDGTVTARIPAGD